METVAYKFLCAYSAGLVLSGANSDCEAEFVGTEDKWVKYRDNVAEFLATGTLPENIEKYV